MSKNAIGFACLLLIVWLVPLAGLAADEAGREGDREALAFEEGGDLWLAPPVLSPADVKRYREIFRLGEAGDWPAVDALIRQLEDPLLVGHALTQRYLHPWAYRSKFVELSGWLQRYEPHPDSDRIRRLALQKKPKDGATALVPATEFPYRFGGSEAGPRLAPLPTRSLGAAERKRASGIKASIELRLRKGWTKSAKRLLSSDEATRLLSQAERDAYGARLGQSYLVDGRYEWAIDWAKPATGASARYVPQSYWTVGLASWHLGRYADAAAAFGSLAERRDVPAGMRSAAAFWAARAHLYLKAPEAVIHWLARAAAHPWSFYGLLARRILGLPVPFAWTLTEAEEAAARVALATEPVRRGLALLQIDQIAQAESEFLLAWRAAADADAARAVLAIAEHAGLSELAMHLQGVEFAAAPKAHRAAYPVPAWAPQGGFVLDRALLYAITRKESRFDPEAKSGAGARGLMQLMPSTAQYVARRLGDPDDRVSALHQPAVNLEFGQRYLSWLLSDPVVDGDLLLALAAWNGGIGNVRAWIGRDRLKDDPLLFIESIPLKETRRFVKAVLANLWVYRHRLGQPAPTLDALAAGRWPAYQSVEVEVAPTEVAYHDND